MKKPSGDTAGLNLDEWQWSVQASVGFNLQKLVRD